MFLILRKKQRRTLKWIRKRNRQLPLCAILRLLHSLPDCQTISNPLQPFLMEAILNAADGTPRMINKYCNQSMLIGDSNKASLITTDIVMQAVNDCELG